MGNVYDDLEKHIEKGRRKAEMKKTVCFLLSVMLMLPALPAAMATGGQEETVTTVTPADAAYIRNGAHADTALGGKTLVVDGGAGENRRVTYLKFDLSSYMEEIEKCDEIEFSLMPNLSPSPANANFLVYLLPDHLEGWSSEELTFRKATEMDMVDDGGELIYASPDTLTHGQVHRTGNIRDAVVRHLGENPGNSVISLKVDSTLGAGYVIYSDSGRGPKLTITRTINYSDIVQNAWDSLTFDKLSGETEESVCMDLTLPEMLGDSVTVEWESSDPSVIDVSTGFVYRPRRNETAAEVRLTAKLSAGGYERTKEFILTVPAGERVPEDMIAGTESSYATDGRAVRRGIEHADTVQGNTYMQIDGRPSDGLQREVFLKFDLSGCAELWKTVDSLTFTLRTYSDSNVKDQNNFYGILAAGRDGAVCRRKFDLQYC